MVQWIWCKLMLYCFFVTGDCVNLAVQEINLSARVKVIQKMVAISRSSVVNHYHGTVTEILVCQKFWSGANFFIENFGPQTNFFEKSGPGVFSSLFDKRDNATLRIA